MKKALLVTALILFISMPVLAQEYWDLKTSFQGTLLKLGDSNGMAYGGGVNITFGVPGGKYEFGFEAGKWWRSFDLFDPEVQALRDGDLLDTNTSNMEHSQEGLSFAALTRYRVYSLMGDGMLDLYSGVGGGFYFLQENCEEARQDPITGIWAIEKVDNYLETKGQTFIMLGLSGTLMNKLEFLFENRFTYIFDWDRWDDPYALSSSLGLKYNF